MNIPKSNDGKSTPIIPLKSSKSPKPWVRSRHSKLTVISAEEAIEMFSPFKVLEYGGESSGKTHMGMTFPSPVCVIDTEHKYHTILKKFRHCNDCENDWCTTDTLKSSNPPKFVSVPTNMAQQQSKKYVGGKKCPSCGSTNVCFKDIKGISCRTSDDAIEAMNVFFDILSEEYEKSGKLGTIVVDSISKIWEWCRSEYSVKKYGASPDEGVVLNPRNDYAFINPKHNTRFRDKLLESPYNIVLIATAKPLYDENDQFKIIGHAPEGQKHNQYAVDVRIFNEQGIRTLNDGTILGDGNFKSSITKNGILEGNLDPIPFLNYKRLVIIRKQLEEMACMNDMPEKTEKPEKSEKSEDKP